MANLNIRIDDNLKREAELLFDDLGVSLSAAMTIFLKQAIRQNGFPFQITRNYNRETMEAMEDVRLGRNLSGPYKSMDELIEALNA